MILPIYATLIGNFTPGQSGPGSNDNEQYSLSINCDVFNAAMELTLCNCVWQFNISAKATKVKLDIWVHLDSWRSDHHIFIVDIQS